MKIAVCVPHYGPLNARFVSALTDLVSLTASADVTYNGEVVRPRVGVLFEENGPLDLKRTRLVKRAMAASVDYIQWIDNDHTFPPDATLRLAAHDLPIVGCNYIQRAGPPQPTAIGFDGKFIATTPSKRDQVEAVAAVGFGFCLVKAPVFEAVPPPWFTTVLTPDGEVVQSDDIYFGNQARSAGIPIHLDHDLSLEIGHIGEVIRMNTEVEASDA